MTYGRLVSPERGLLLQDIDGDAGQLADAGHSYVAVGRQMEWTEAVTPKAEWIAVQGEVVWYLVSVDFDVAPLHRRLADADLLLRAIVTAATERRR